MRIGFSLSAAWLRAFVLLALFVALPLPAQADPADIDAAARGVVRVVIIQQTSDGIVAVSHGTGFAITPERIVTNAHVVADARQDRDLSIGIVPSDGENAVYGRLISVSPRNDLALVATTSPMNLPPLTLSGNAVGDSGAVTAVGYPMNVDRAQGLSMSDIFRAQPPVKSIGFLSGRRPTRDFDSLLHTAPIARGNSGGPLLDQCGRVIGVNSFGAESGGADAEFFFAVSIRELMPFLRANDAAPRVNGLPCRSLADLDEAERQRTERVQMAAQAREQADSAVMEQRREEMRRDVEFGVTDERENGLILTFFFLGLTIAGAAFSFFYYEHAKEGARMKMKFAGGLAIFALVLAAISWISRPGFDSIADRLEEQLRAEMSANDNGPIPPQSSAGALLCVLDTARSRITTAPTDDLPFEWSDSGCVNGRTQYGFNNGEWTRVLVPSSEAAVSVNRFNPETGEYRSERYLLGRKAMSRARIARGEYDAPTCKAPKEELENADESAPQNIPENTSENTGTNAAAELGAKQMSILSLLPARPNERLVYNCNAVP